MTKTDCMLKVVLFTYCMHLHQ